MSKSRSFRGLLCTAALLCVASAPGWSQSQNANVTVDENGHGTLTTPFVTNLALPFSVIADPGPGGKSNVLNYNLLGPPSLVAGDVLLHETGDFNSDLIRFDSVTGGGSFFFYSDLDDGVVALADIGLPGARETNLVTLQEINLAGGGNGAIYTPTSGQPGFVTGFNVTYTFISDTAAPEPASFFLVLPAAAVAIYRRRKRSSLGIPA